MVFSFVSLRKKHPQVVWNHFITGPAAVQQRSGGYFRILPKKREPTDLRFFPSVV
jgi:hypothetical protein